MCDHYMAAVVACQEDIGHLVMMPADARMAVVPIRYTMGVSSIAFDVSTDRLLFSLRATGPPE